LTAAEAEVAAAVGRSAARRGLTLVSGGARGADRIAMDACLRAGGRVIGILPHDLSRAAVDAYRAGIRDGRLTLLSPWEPEAPWVTEHAFARNALIYAAADAAAIVVAAQEGRGGTWGGVTQYLTSGNTVPVFVNPAAKAAKALVARGASPLPKDWLE
jgi:predicted Rossmann fold nucleotide-binding protein DprA/Smf involved in DNA uptake